jgi:hypothetical protein
MRRSARRIDAPAFRRRTYRRRHRVRRLVAGRRTAILCTDVGRQTLGPEVAEEACAVESEPSVQQGRVVREVGIGLVGVVLAALLVVARDHAEVLSADDDAVPVA